MEGDLEVRIVDLETRMARLETVVPGMAEDARTTREIVEAWNRVKGFGAVIKFTSSALKVLWPFVALLIAIVMFAKTGHWSWPSAK